MAEVSSLFLRFLLLNSWVDLKTFRSKVSVEKGLRNKPTKYKKKGKNNWQKATKFPKIFKKMLCFGRALLLFIVSSHLNYILIVHVLSCFWRRTSYSSKLFSWLKGISMSLITRWPRGLKLRSWTLFQGKPTDVETTSELLKKSWGNDKLFILHHYFQQFPKKQQWLDLLNPKQKPPGFTKQPPVRSQVRWAGMSSLPFAPARFWL